ncbi:MAG TPA: hypothetical protein VGH28_25910 [Polyangiaceae bacterium]|jgi:hypothetical protein
MGELRYAERITDDEVAAGFDVIEHTSGRAIVSRPIPGGLLAVKIHGDDGSFEYVICDRNLSPLYTAAKTLPELERRFQSKR